jgi:hypothetical protein
MATKVLGILFSYKEKKACFFIIYQPMLYNENCEGLSVLPITYALVCCCSIHQASRAIFS